MQNAFQAIEECRWPVLAAVHGANLGAAIDLLTACDIVYATKDAFFSIKEIDLSMTADLGTLQRLPILAANWSYMKELALTARKFKSHDAMRLGIVSRVWDTKEICIGKFTFYYLDEIMKTAEAIAQKSPIAIIGTKKALNYARTKQVQKGLRFIKVYNMSQLYTVDMAEGVASIFQKKAGNFPKL